MASFFVRVRKRLPLQMIKRSVFFSLVFGVICAGCQEQSEPANHAAAAAPSSVVMERPAAPASESEPAIAFADWMQACAKLPSNLESGFRLPAKELLPLKRFSELEVVLDHFFEWSTNGVMRSPDVWVGAPPAADEFFDASRVYFEPPAIPFQPFTQKLVVPADGEVFFHGDFHGDVQSLTGMLAWLNEQGYLNGFKILRPTTYLVFLGDYTDRGVYGTEVLYTLLRLKTENPERVWMTRGNHEDIGLTSRYGFIQEFVAKFGMDRAAIRKVSRIYDFLPVALYLGTGTDFVQCNHGGLEPGYDPTGLLAAPGETRFQLLGELRQSDFFDRHPELMQSVPGTDRMRYSAMWRNFKPLSPIAPGLIGFMWNDFTLLGTEPAMGYDAGRGWVFGEAAARATLRAGSEGGRNVRAVFRAHQHSSALNPMMRRLRSGNGLFRHWQENDTLPEADDARLRKTLDVREARSVPDGSVWTFNVAPDSVYGRNCGFTFDTFGLLTVRERFDQWSLRVINRE
jgi:hypothetical protein